MKYFFSLIFFTFSCALFSHGGGLDRYGCHKETKTGGYHCHRSSGWGGSLPSIGNTYGQGIKDEIKRSIQIINKVFGGLDILVNNAGYGYLAAIEEGEDEEVRKLFETNFFGALELTKAALPGMRAQKFGRIINNSSQAGIMANPGTGYYSSSKYALEGLMAALDKELRPLNISVTSVQPGAFRTDWSGRSMKRSTVEIDDYSEHVKERIDMISKIDGKQPGDPVRAAKIIFELSRNPNPPDKLLLGAGVLTTYKEKLSALLNQIDEFEQTTLSADFPQDNS